jgi:hypothetical protein
MRDDIKSLRRATEAAISAEEQAVRQELHHDVLQLRDEVQRLREDLRRAGVLGDKVGRTER